MFIRPDQYDTLSPQVDAETIYLSLAISGYIAKAEFNMDVQTPDDMDNNYSTRPNH